MDIRRLLFGGWCAEGEEPIPDPVLQTAAKEAEAGSVAESHDGRSVRHMMQREAAARFLNLHERQPHSDGEIAAAAFCGAGGARAVLAISRM